MSKVYSERIRVTEPEPLVLQTGAGSHGSECNVFASRTSHSDRTGSEEFMLRCLSASREPPAVSLEPTTDWTEVFAMAVSHGLAPLLFKCLKQSDAWACVPADVWERLRRAYIASAGRNMRLYRELGSVLRCLHSSGIPVIVLKGAFLAEAVYGDIALRPMADVDLLVPRMELPKVQAILLNMGYGPREREDIELLCRRTKGLAPFVRADYSIEPHWSIVHPTSPFRIDTAGLWARAQPAVIAGVSVLALSPEDLLLHLCLHTSHKHSLGQGLQPFCDIAEAIRHYDSELDRSQFVDRAHEWGAARYVGLTLYLARSLLGVTVPDDTLGRLVPGGLDQRILETARESVLAQTGYERWVPFFDPFGAKSFRDKAKLSWERVFLSRDEMATIYPSSRDSRHLHFYYALRFRDVIRAFGSYVLRRARLVMQSRGLDRKVSLVTWLKSGRPVRQAKVRAKVEVEVRENP